MGEILGEIKFVKQYLSNCVWSVLLEYLQTKLLFFFHSKTSSILIHLFNVKKRAPRIDHLTPTIRQIEPLDLTKSKTQYDSA